MRLLLALTLACGASVLLGAAAHAAPPATPPASKLVLAASDFPDGAVVASVSTKIDPTFAVSDLVPASSEYTRRFRDVKLGSLELPAVLSSAFVAQSQSRAVSLLAELQGITHPGNVRRTLVDAMRGGMGADMTVSFIRGRTLRLGDAAVEFVVRINRRGGGSFDLAETWIRTGSAVSAVAVISPDGLTLGKGFELAKLMAARMKS
jgi:hypothetical protein